MIDTINTVDSTALWDNLITSHQVDYMSLALISSEAAENDQWHITSCSIKVGSITP